MSIFHYQYQMEISFSSPCREHSFSLMCFPSDNKRQKVLSSNVKIEPNALLQESCDWLGNKKTAGIIEGVHTSFSVCVEGEAETYANFYEDKGFPEKFYFYSTPHTAAGNAIKKLAKKIQAKTDYDKAMAALSVVHECIEYKSGVTNNDTTAETALTLGYGVCQDFTHIYLAVLKELGIACRYVAGMVQGEGHTHAWAEVNCNGFWYAVDPTANKLVGDGYLKFSHGRDCTDTAINRGCFKGFANQLQIVTASLKKSEELSDGETNGREYKNNQ